jgi:hypothetical protein
VAKKKNQLLLLLHQLLLLKLLHQLLTHLLQPLTPPASNQSLTETKKPPSGGFFVAWPSMPLLEVIHQQLHDPLG